MWFALLLMILAIISTKVIEVKPKYHRFSMLVELIFYSSFLSILLEMALFFTEE